MKIFQTVNTKIPEILAQIAAQRSMPDDVRARVETIIQDVKVQGDSTLYALAERFDGVKLKILAVSKEEIAAAYKAVSPAVVQSLKQAIKNIKQLQKHFGGSEKKMQKRRNFFCKMSNSLIFLKERRWE